jgi:hypothetical protein
MAGWTKEERTYIQRHWERSKAGIWLTVACPGCAHPNAFSHITVYPETVRPGSRHLKADRALRVLKDDKVVERMKRGDVGARLEILGLKGASTFPDTVVVDCRCKHAKHVDGCGRSGKISTSKL